MTDWGHDRKKGSRVYAGTGEVRCSHPDCTEVPDPGRGLTCSHHDWPKDIHCGKRPGHCACANPLFVSAEAL